MKKIFVVVLSLLVSNISFSQWMSISPLPSGVSMNSMQFIDNNTGWVLCTEGLILKTTNRGEDWISLNTGSTSYLRSVSFIDSQTGWVVGNDNTLLKTTDGGNNWTQLNTGQPANSALGYVKFFNENVGYIVGGYSTGERGMNFTTIDNGKSWITNTNEDKSWFDTVYYNKKNELVAEIFDFTTNKILELKSEDNGNIWVTKDNGRGTWLREITYKTNGAVTGLSVDFRSVTFFCLKTTDGGETWIQKPALSTNTISFTDEITGFDDTNGKLYKTTDSGKNWNLIYEDCCSSPQVIFFLDNQHGWMGGEDLYYPFRRTTDGGNTWLFKSSSSDGNVKDIFFLSANEGWVAAAERQYPNFSMYGKTTDGGATFENYFVPEFTAINSFYFTGSNSGWAIGENSKLMRTNSNGDFKIFSFFGEQTNIKSIHFIDSQNGWCVDSDEDNSWGSFGNIWKTSDGGKNWELLKTFEWGDLVNDIFFIDENNGWFAGWDGVIANTADGGYMWTWQWYSGDDVFYDIHFTDTQNGWVVGGDGLILFTTDGGNNWNYQTTGTAQRLNSVHFIDNQIGWIAGNEGTIFKTTDGGTNWFSQINVSNQLKSIFSVNQNIVYAVGSNGVILKTTNSGIDWFAQINETTNTLNQVIFSDVNNGWTVGNSGTILYTSNGGIDWSPENSGTTENLLSLSFVDGNIGWAAGNHSTLLKYTATVPVELISFTSEIDNNKVTLNWETASETNNLGFEVERKTDGEWITIGFVEGHSTSTQAQSYLFIDNLNELSSGLISYRLKQVDFDGSFEYSNIIEVNFNSVPDEFVLSQNYPNPFNPTTKIEYRIPLNPPLLKGESEAGGFITLKVYDILGNEVANLVNEQKPAGNYEVEFDANEFASGTYFYKLETDNFTSIKKMILLK